jgi:hypothetical protein
LSKSASPKVFSTSKTHFVAGVHGDSDFLSGETVVNGIYAALGLLCKLSACRLKPGWKWLYGQMMLVYAARSRNGAIKERVSQRIYSYRLSLDSGQTVRSKTPYQKLLSVGERYRSF